MWHKICGWFVFDSLNATPHHPVPFYMKTIITIIFPLVIIKHMDNNISTSCYTLLDLVYHMFRFEIFWSFLNNLSQVYFNCFHKTILK